MARWSAGRRRWKSFLPAPTTFRNSRLVGTLCVFCIIGGFSIISGSGQAPPAAAPTQSNELFETKIRPLLAANCFACHGESAMAGLRVDSREGLLRGGANGPVVVPGDPEKSALLKAVQHAEGFPRMPRGRAKLPAADIEALAEWIRAGAVWPVSGDAPALVASHERTI